MKSFIKKLLPHWLRPLVRSIYWKLVKLSRKPSLSSTEFDRKAPLQQTVGENKYGRYCVPLSSADRLAAQKVLTGEVYEPDTIQFMITHCGDGDIVHAGTYFGDFLPALSKSCSELSKVWAFEPNPENYECAKETVNINNLENVELTNAGLGEISETLTMLTTDEDGHALGGRSRLLDVDRNALSGGVETVQIVSIDEVVPPDRTVSIIQLDVEGHEEKALSGAMHTIHRSLPIIIVEAYSEMFFNTDWYIKNIASLGYQIDRRVHNNTVLMVGAAQTIDSL